MRQILNWNGRVKRTTFWKFFIFFYFTCYLIGWADSTFTTPEPLKSVTVILFLILLYPAIIIQIKRWHDMNKSGFWVLINFIPIFGSLWSLIECGFVKGTDGPNKYGQEPH